MGNKLKSYRHIYSSLSHPLAAIPNQLFCLQSRAVVILPVLWLLAVVFSFYFVLAHAKHPHPCAYRWPVVHSSVRVLGIIDYVDVSRGKQGKWSHVEATATLALVAVEPQHYTGATAAFPTTYPYRPFCSRIETTATKSTQTDRDRAECEQQQQHNTKPTPNDVALYVLAGLRASLG